MLVQSIYDASIRILQSIGSAGLTTKKVADLAGVSIGSFYQYFSSKDALLGSMIDITLKAQQTMLTKEIAASPELPLEEATRLFIRRAVEESLAHRTVSRELFRRVMELNRFPLIIAMRAQIADQIALAMPGKYPGHAPERYRRAGFIVVNSVMGVLETLLYDESQTYSSEEVIEELITSALAYFDRSLGQPVAESRVAP